MKFEVLGPNFEVLQVVESNANPIRIGKNASCELCLNDDSVSRVHAVLEKVSNGYKLSDRISQTGTFVNQQKVESTKPVMVTNGAILRFGQVSVRLVLDDVMNMGISELSEMDGEDGDHATLSVPTPVLQEMAAADPSVAPAAPVAPPAPAAPAAPAAPPAPSVTAPAAARPAAKAAGFGGGAAAAGMGKFAQSSAPATTIIRKKKRPVSFERRFLSARGKSANCKLEVAMVWRDTVLSIDQYPASSGTTVTVGSDSTCNYKVVVGNTSKIAVAQCIGGKWELLFNNAYEGFVLIGNNKIPFASASSADFRTPRSSVPLPPGSLACEVNGETRAKFVFGEVSILVHFVDAVPFAAPLFSLSSSNYGGLVASLLIHFALFSVILFATNRVDALMVDRILNTSRFAVVVEEPVVEEPEEEMQEEEEPEEEEPEEDQELTKDAPDTPFAANTAANDASTPGKGMSKGEAVGAAQATGLLAQANAMNSMLAVGNAMDLDNLDWSSFDASAQAASAGYGLGASGTGGGGAGMGGFGAGGFGPGGGGGGGAIRTASQGYNANLGAKGEARPQVKMKNPEVTGALDKRIIQKVVRQHSGELRACYEKELNKIKGLNGRVVVVWLISPQGAVTKALVKESTIKNKNVENCVVNSIKFWRFPAPKGGGIVQIEYPFVFEAGSAN